MEENKAPQKMSKVKQHIILSIMTVILTGVLILVGYNIYYHATADPEGFAVKLNEICDHFRINYISYENEIYRFSVDDELWNNNGQMQKIAYCRNIHEAIKTALDMYHIQKKSDSLLIRLYGNVPDGNLGFGCVAMVGEVTTDIYY